MGDAATWGKRRAILDVLGKLHLARPAVWTYEQALAAKSALVPSHEDRNGLPLPPARLRAQVGPRHADADFFLRSGREQAALIRSMLGEGGASIEHLDAILDWGCGCGRIVRHWSALPPRTGVFGCDINPKMIAWCETNLPFAEVAVTELVPPLPYESSTFGLVYAFSVFTHLSEELQQAWIGECLRVLEPGGYLLLSTLGEHYLSLGRLSESERESFGRGNVVVLYEQAAGTSLCSAYHPPEYVHRNLGADFELVAFRPASDFGQHDMHLLRRPATS